ncbi:hypothetical protein SAMN04489760_11286 [Syntrophus gentianae]|uniref:Phosphatidylglycerol lysyltransferase C-terminal domain-containing protein n=1 Tax=Syntrophus gentianae TaxID=43775 RepID=A0A1H7XY93_9BACT|nr:phosphatidylglycerol lysyltransferase domain-containing protein [Syntrophus gentianae]SEM38057.1 hypothetical protein SAMN04489760_11286 [Syntrophus gentianae]
MTSTNSFQLLTLADFPPLKPFFHSLKNPLAIYSLPSLIAWNSEANPTYYALEDDLLLLRMKEISLQDSNPGCLLLPLCPGREIPPPELADLARRYSLPTFCFVPESYVRHFGCSSLSALFSLTEQPDYSDYIYRRRDLIELKGNRYRSKRNHISKFRKLYVETGRTTIEPLCTANIPETLLFLKRWCAENNRCDPEENLNLALESQACRILLEHLEFLEGQGIAVRIDGEVFAFGIATTLNSSMKVLNVEKADSHIPGLYQFLDQECARRLFEGVEYINKESDMGIPGLASSKKSYDPVKRIRSYQVTLLDKKAI